MLSVLLLSLSVVGRCLEALCGLTTLEHIDKEMLSLCFKSLGNSIMSLSELFGAVRGCSGLLKDVYALRGIFHHCFGELSLIWQSLMTVYVYA